MTRRSLFIAAFVAVQVALPLSYYAVAGDSYDERFAWRMFSPTRLARCQVELRANDRPVRLSRVFHIAWIKTLQRGRKNVVEAMAQHLCELADYGPPVNVRMSCRGVDGNIDEIADGTTDLCPSGALR